MMAMLADISSQATLVLDRTVQFCSWKTQHLHLSLWRLVLFQLWHWLLQHQNAGKDIGILKDGCMTEINNTLQGSLFGKVGSQWLAIACTHPLIRDNVGHSPICTSQAQPLLVKVDIEVSDSVIRFRVHGSKIGF